MADPTSRSQRLSRVVRPVLGSLAAIGILAAAGVVGFMGVWTYVGYKSPGDTGPGSLLLMAAIGMCAGAGAVLAWAFSWRRAMKTIAISFGFAGSALVVWVLSAN